VVLLLIYLLDISSNESYSIDRVGRKTENPYITKASSNTKTLIKL